MNKSLWLRLYVGIVDCRKIQSLSDRLFRVMVSLWCLAKENDGVLPPVEDAAWRLRLKIETVRTAMAELCSARLLDEVDGFYVPHDWKEHQYESDSSAARVARYRDRVRQTGAVVGNYLKHKSQVFARDGNACVYCGATENLCLDHMIPILRGGDDSPENLCTACKQCNSGKAGRTPEQAGYPMAESARDAYAITLSRLHPDPVTVTEDSDGCDLSLSKTATVTPRAGVRSVSVSVSALTHTQKELSGIGESAACASDGFHEFWERYPHKVNQDQAAREWISVDAGMRLATVFECLESYEQSDLWARGIYQKPENWIRDRATGKWKDRPARAASSQRDKEVNRLFRERMEERARKIHPEGS